MSHEALIKTGLADRCVSVPVLEATDEDILLIHRSVLLSTRSLHLVQFIVLLYEAEINT